MNYADIVIPEYCEGVMRRNPNQAQRLTCQRAIRIHHMIAMRRDIEEQRTRVTRFNNPRRRQNMSRWITDAERRFVEFYENSLDELNDLDSCTCDE
jgi:hypothetical protein